jgi:hypothetical protein
MHTIGYRFLRSTALVGLVLTVAPAALGAQAAIEARIDSLFAAFTQPGTPGCALGVAREAVERPGLATSMRCCEHDDHDLEAAGVQAVHVAAILLLQRDAGVADDDVRRCRSCLTTVPVTLRHAASHVRPQGLGAIAGIRGGHAIPGPRAMPTRRDHRRVRELNFPPGTEHDNSNTN